MNEISVAATEFSRHFGKYQDDAFGIDVVKVTSHGRVVGAYLSAVNSKIMRWGTTLWTQNKRLIAAAKKLSLAAQL
jgi:hypothetical protein